MTQDYLNIARKFQATREESDKTTTLDTSRVDLSRPRDNIQTTPQTPVPCEISELSELSPLFDGLDEGAVSKAYETKATVPGQKPPLQQIEEMQAWLATIDWRYGLKCGLSGQQCKVCKGIPCRGSTEWE